MDVKNVTLPLKESLIDNKLRNLYVLVFVYIYKKIRENLAIQLESPPEADSLMIITDKNETNSFGVFLSFNLFIYYYYYCYYY